MYEQKEPGRQTIRQREQRHRKLMKMIKNYKRLPEEVQKLEKIKNNTMMEINLRYIRSEHNRKYRFPKNISDEESEEEKSPFQPKEPTLYDLKSQNQIVKNDKSKKLLSLDSTQRVKSLEQQRETSQSNRLGRLNEIKEKHFSYKQLKKNSLILSKKINSHIKLPNLASKEKIRTQSKNQARQIEKVIGKKLMTEISQKEEMKNAAQKHLFHKKGKKPREKMINVFYKQDK